MKKLICLITILFLIGCNAEASDNGKSETVRYQAEGESMYPTFENGDVLHVDQSYYKKNEVKRGDIIVFKNAESTYMKRVIGLPNETILVENGEIYIDGKPIEAEYISEEISDFGEVIIPEDSYFVIGDNAMISKDSRNGLGFITSDQIEGKVMND
ncbi:signal peptidase I [Salirhabdus sp. Marseille-P4669]|uniref:signal peptidase I n=1 Tax=Salirhabdus sp. Marseille-P4669 TaxID=2042310 RepID=UPI000C7CAC66|nr:signal peptidase I [Salirhabdus sp. Marseille-P4669]